KTSGGFAMSLLRASARDRRKGYQLKAHTRADAVPHRETASHGFSSERRLRTGRHQKPECRVQADVRRDVKRRIESGLYRDAVVGSLIGEIRLTALKRCVALDVSMHHSGADDRLKPGDAQPHVEPPIRVTP